MATTNFHPDHLLLRVDRMGAKLNWNSTDSEYHYMKNRSKIDSYYSDTNVQYTYNSEGYRAPEFDSLDNDFILCFGCSYTEGVGVTDADTWPARLESVSGMQSVNLGMGGSSTQAQIINATQWIRSGKPLPKCVVMQIPEVTREPCASLRHDVANQIAMPTGKGLSVNKQLSSIFINGTRPSYTPGNIKDDMIYNGWRDYRNTFPSEIVNPDNYNKEPDITPWFMNSMYMTQFQTMWNALGVPVLQMTYDDDGDFIYNPNNVFRITGEIQLDVGRDRCHQGVITHQALAEAIWPEIQELLEWNGTVRAMRSAKPTLHRQKRDIRRLPYDRTQCTMPQAMAKIEDLDKKKGGPFIYE